MKYEKISRDFWQKALFSELAICSLISLITAIWFADGPHSFSSNIANVITLVVIILFNLFQDRNHFLSDFTRWINLIFLPSIFCASWVSLGNLLLSKNTLTNILVILFLWLLYIFLLLPVAMTSASQIKNWLLRLIAVFLLDVQYGPDADLKIKKLPILNSFNYQGVIAAVALLVIACFLAKAWGFNFNPNLKFQQSQSFQWSIFAILIIYTLIDLWWNCFDGNGNTLFSVLFDSEIGPFHFTWNNFTSALEPAILEETERYLMIVILLYGFNKYPKWRVPIAVYASTILFGLEHLSNIGVNGQSLAATISQVIGVMGAMLWAVLYLYTGKLWSTMLVHFLMDYLINLQSGWDSAETWSGSTGDWLATIIPVIVPLIFTIWMMFGKRRQVMEENANRILNI